MRRRFLQPDCRRCSILKHSFFSHLAEERLQFLCSHKTSNIYRKGQTIFYEGNPAAGLYFLYSGKVKIFKAGLGGREQIVRLVSPGGLLDYRALMRAEVYAVSATTLEDSIVCFLDKEDFFCLLEKDAVLSFKLIQFLGQELETAERTIRDLAQKTVRERLAEVLLDLNISLSREDLANLVGTATETVVRVLSDFKRRKFISVAGRRIQILNRPGLVETARLD